MAKTTMVRVNVLTLARLHAYRAGLIQSVQLGRKAGVTATEWQDRGPWVSLDECIGVLLDQVEQHKERSRRAGARRRKK